jgi:acetyl-CoA acetyltransferase
VTAGPDVLISGIGQSAIGRGLFRSDLDLTLDACLDAIADASLTRADIDGLATYPSRHGPASRYGGIAGPATLEVQDALRLDLGWHGGGSDGPGHMGAVLNAIGAIAAGLCRHVLVYRTVTEASLKLSRRATAAAKGRAPSAGPSPAAPTEPPAPHQHTQWTGGAINPIAAAAQRHFHQFGTTREMLGSLAVNSRRNAGRNPKAVLRAPITMDDYLDARWITTPLGLLDCDILVDASTAFVLSSGAYAADLPNAVRILQVGSGVAGRTRWDQRSELLEFTQRAAAASLWARTDLRQTDVDVLEIYDGFSYLTLAWIEALGFAETGMGGHFLASGDIAFEGRYPLNTHGGQLSEGRTHGFGFLHEACLQVRGQAGERQVPGRHEIALVAVGGLGATCMLLAMV